MKYCSPGTACSVKRDVCLHGVQNACFVYIGCILTNEVYTHIVHHVDGQVY